MTTSSNELLWNHAIENEDYSAAKELEAENSKIEAALEYGSRPQRRAMSSQSAKRILAMAQQHNAEYTRARSAALLDAAETAGTASSTN